MQVWTQLKTVIAYNAGYRAGEVARETGATDVDWQALCVVLDGMYDSWCFDRVSRDQAYDAYEAGMIDALRGAESLTMAQVAIAFD